MTDTGIGKMMNFLIGVLMLAIGGFTWWAAIQSEIETAWASSAVGCVAIGAAAFIIGIQLGRLLAFKFEIPINEEHVDKMSAKKNLDTEHPVETTAIEAGEHTSVVADVIIGEDSCVSYDESDMVRVLQSLPKTLKDTLLDVYENGMVWIPTREETPQQKSLVQEGFLENNNYKAEIHNGGFCYEYSVADKWKRVIRDHKGEIFLT